MINIIFFFNFFLIIGLWSSCKSCWLGIDLKPLSQNLKNLWAMEAKSLWYPSFFVIFAMLNAWSLKNLSEDVLLLNL